MAIEVRLSDESTELMTHDGDWFEILPSGALALHYGDGIRSSNYFAPHAWEYVSSPQPPGPIAEAPTIL
ncbi:hypothetical protein [Mycolicibacterium fortuitum]|jgi:hypothetical protein|uniref:hypothetical protein n=1 Tax=Mycolicibacterium fortuitum TaxID=1766 RepID=UPI003AAFEDB2